VHPLDFRATAAQLEEALSSLAFPQVDLSGTFARIVELRDALDELYETADGIDTVEAARPVNDALLRIGRELVGVLYSSAGTYQQDPALHIPLLPQFAAAAEAVGSVPDGVVRTELVRARNRLDRALANATAEARAAAR
jgi:uncharacterized protein HemX